MEKYTVCHTCQLQGLRHCNEADKCLSAKEYPLELRDMVEREYNGKTPLSIIAEKAFDLGQSQHTATALAEKDKQIDQLIQGLHIKDKALAESQARVKRLEAELRKLKA